MTKKTIYLLILFCFIVILYGYLRNEHVIFQDNIDGLLDYKFKFKDINNVEKKLSKQKFSHTFEPGIKYISVIVLGDKVANVKEYVVTDSGSIDITIPQGKEFIISFHANQIITYTWRIKNTLEQDVVKLKNKFLFRLPTPRSRKRVDGEEYSRENFQFESLDKGIQKVKFRYEHTEEEREEYFEITININSL